MECKIATTEDTETIRRIAEEVWPVAYKDIISKEQMKYMLEWMYSDDALVRQMTEEGCVFFLLHEGDRCTGFAGVSLISEHKAKLHKLYVLSTGQGRGGGTVLLNQAITWARMQGADTMELQVNKNNSAIKFYTRHAFAIAEEKVFDIGNGYVMDDYIMARAL